MMCSEYRCSCRRRNHGLNLERSDDETSNRNTLLLSLAGLGCGSGDDVASVSDPDPDSAATTGAPASAETDAGVEPDAGADGDVGDLGDHGGVTITMSGDHEVSSRWVFVPEASYFSGWWTMTFTDLSIEGGAILALTLDPANLFVSYGDGEVTVVGGAPQCTFDVEHQDEGGASGSFDCEHLTGITLTGNLDDVSFSGSFDAKV